MSRMDAKKERNQILEQHIAKLQELQNTGEDLDNPIELRSATRVGSIGVEVVTVVHFNENLK